MIDVSNSLFSALPPSFRNNGVPSTVSLVKPAASEAGGNSVRTVASRFKPDTNVGNFAPPAEGQEGFASLSSALASVRLPPAVLNPLSNSNYTPTWERLIQEQNLIADSRVEKQQRFEDLQQQRDDDAAQRAADAEAADARARRLQEFENIQQAREDEAARRAANEQRAREIRTNILLDQSARNSEPPNTQPEDNVPPFSTVRPQANETSTSVNQGIAGAQGAEDSSEVEISLPGQGQNLPENQAAPLSGQTEGPEQKRVGVEDPQVSPPSQDTSQNGSDVFRADQERLQRLFFPGESSFQPAESSAPFSSYA